MRGDRLAGEEDETQLASKTITSASGSSCSAASRQRIGARQQLGSAGQDLARRAEPDVPRLGRRLLNVELGPMNVRGPGRSAAPASSASIASISSSPSSKSKTSKFSLDPLRGHRLGDHDVAELQVPADHDLRRRPAVRLGDLDDRGVVEHRALRERAPGLGDDPELARARGAARLLEVGVQLDLVDRRRLARLRDHPPQCSGWKFETPIARDQALVAELDERPPGLHVAVVRRHRPVDQVEVEVVELQPPRLL